MGTAEHSRIRRTCASKVSTQHSLDGVTVGASVWACWLLCVLVLHQKKLISTSHHSAPPLCLPAKDMKALGAQPCHVQTYRHRTGSSIEHVVAVLTS